MIDIYVKITCVNMLWSNPFLALQDTNLDRYLDSQGLNPDQCWRSKLCEAFPTSDDLYYNRVRFTSKLVASFIEMVLKNVKTH